MQYRTLGRTSLNVSGISMGCWNIGGQWGDVSEADAVATLRRAQELGVNLFDTADAYGVQMGTSEELLGKTFSTMRDKLIYVSKVGNWARRFGHPFSYTSPLHIINCCHASLYRLKTDVIDVYLCHIGDLPEPTIFLEAFDTLKRQGKIRFGGISTNSADAVARFNARGTCDVVQLDYSLLNRKPEEVLLPYCKKHNIGVMARGVLAMGLLGGKYDATTIFNDQVRQSWNSGTERDRYLQRIATVEKIRAVFGGETNLAAVAIQFALANDTVSCVIPGAKNAKQAEANAAAGELNLSPMVVEALRAATA